MKKYTLITTLIVAALSAAAHAHPGHGPASGIEWGLIHPMTGLDHVCAMLAVGLWAAQRGGRAVWAVPLSFVGMMMLGVRLGAAGVGFPAVEQAIAASVLVLGLLIACAVRMPLATAGALAGFFALFHGHAHAAGMPEGASGFAYCAGLALSTALLHSTGIIIARQAARPGKIPPLRLAGGAIAACGFCLLLAA